MPEKNNSPLLAGFFILLIIVLIESFYLYEAYKKSSSLLKKTSPTPGKILTKTGLDPKTVKAYTLKAKKGLVSRSTLTNQYVGALVAVNLSGDKKLTLKGSTGTTLVFTYPQNQLSKIKLYKKTGNKLIPLTWTDLKIGNNLTITETVSLLKKSALALQQAFIVVIK